jgi:SNF2 family DNA or RNA helicase
VPDALLRVLTKVDLSPLIEALAHLPLRRSSHVERHLRRTRQALSSATQDVWRGCTREMQIELPLLILDEAHHLKNRWTRFASLFEAPEAETDAEVLRGAFGSVFDRMLFLTATPFQLGHHELIEVLRRFSAVRWGNGIDRGRYESDIRELERVLTAAQTAALRLDRAWTWLRATDLAGIDSNEWWTAPGGDELPDAVRSICSHVDEVRARMSEAERLLKPWVIRHVRPDRESRRLVRPGRSILDNSPKMTAGLEVGGPAVLPFLLAARVQALVALDGGSASLRARAYFAEGLASSFEAYRDTRLRQKDREKMIDDVEAVETADIPGETRWYLDHLDQALPRDRDAALRDHPKIKATTARALELWNTGEKVVVFCFYIATGKALRAHISRAIQTELLRRGARKLGLDPRQRTAVITELERLGDRFFDPDAPVTRAAGDLVGEIFAARGLSGEERAQGVDIVLRFLRTPTFLVRHVDVGAQDQVAALNDAFEMTDASGRSLRSKIETFAQFLDDRVPEERVELLAALQRINTGTILTSGEALMEGEIGERRALIPNVRLANGEVSREARRRLMLGFNTPFFPEVLISSAVMGEGVDLHLECRHAIHHDLDWNPSVLEQRTGRLDRLGSKSELTHQPIVVYEPYLEGTQDEKQYRVVKDRERWFNVVMGEKLELDEASTDRLADRVPLPDELARRLSLRLEI